MASASNQQAQKSEWGGHLSCPVCFEDYDDVEHQPKCLSCGHTLCLLCAHSINAQQGVRVSIVCPECRQTNAYSSVSDVPTNLSLKSMADLYKAESRLKTDDTENGDDDSLESLVVCESPECNHSGKAGGAWCELDFWVCEVCDTAVFCSTCACRTHETHKKQPHGDFISDRVLKIQTAMLTLEDHVMEFKRLSECIETVKQATSFCADRDSNNSRRTKLLCSEYDIRRSLKYIESSKNYLGEEDSQNFSVRTLEKLHLQTLGMSMSYERKNAQLQDCIDVVQYACSKVDGPSGSIETADDLYKGIDTREMERLDLKYRSDL